MTKPVGSPQSASFRCRLAKGTYTSFVSATATAGNPAGNTAGNTLHV